MILPKDTSLKILISICHCLFAFALFILFSAYAPSSPPGRTPQDRIIDDIFLDISDLKQKVHCYEVEKEILEEKISRQETEITALRNELKNTQRSGEDQAKGKVALLEKRVALLEKVNEGLAADLRLFKTHANEASASMSQLKTQLNELEHNVDTNISHMKKALESVLKLSKKPSPFSEGTPTTSSGAYRVKSGDSLEKIARANRISVEELKKINNLTSDRIIIGQELKLANDELINATH